MVLCVELAALCLELRLLVLTRISGVRQLLVFVVRLGKAKPIAGIVFEYSFNAVWSLGRLRNKLHAFVF